MRSEESGRIYEEIKPRKKKEGERKDPVGKSAERGK